MDKLLRTVLFSALFMLSFSAVHAQIRITEYMYDGANKEWVELTNVGATPVDMTGYSYDDDSRIAGTVSLSAFGIVKPGESVILSEAAAGDFYTAWGLCSGIKVIGSNGTNLGRADEINIFDGSGTLVDRLTFGDQAIPGSIRTQNKSGWVTAAGLGVNNALEWMASAVGDSEGSFASSGGDIGSPGKSTRAVAAYNPCSTPDAGAPSISLDVTATTDMLDGGATTAPANSFAISGALGDATDPASAQGIVFTVADDLTPAADLVVTVSSSNTTVVPDANLVLSGSGATRTLTITPAAAGYSNITVTVNDGTFNTPYVLNYAASAAGATGEKWSTGISDASAVLPLGEDYMLIANDESNFLYVYDRKNSGLPVKTFDINPGNILGLTDGSTNDWKEVDIEAATPSPYHAGRTYWLGSMSNSSSFNDKPNRDRILAVDVSGSGSTATFTNAAHYKGLRSLLITWGDANGYNFTASAAEGVDPKTVEGFNAEGMAFGPDSSTLYIGFRAPLVPTANRTKAVIAPVANFESWFNNGSPAGTPAIGAPIELDLGGRGIRDLIRLTNGSYVIIAGSVDETPIPAVYRWSGNRNDAPVALPSFDLTGLNAEGVLPVNLGGKLSLDQLQIISDNGDNIFYNDGIAAKDLAQANFKKFGNALVQSTIGGVLPIDFESFTAERKDADVKLKWSSAHPGDVASFDVMRSGNGSDYTLVHSEPAFAGQMDYSYTDAGAPASRLFYRIKAKEMTGQSTWSTIRVIGNGDMLAAGVKVYPNPVTNGVFTVTVSQAGAKTLNVYNSAGNLFKQVGFTVNAKDIPTTGWPKGTYLLRILMADGSTATEKIIVQ